MIGPIVLCILFLIGLTLILILYLWLSEYFELRQTMGYIDAPSTYPFVGLSWQMSKVTIEDRFQWLNDLCFKYEKGMVVTWFGIQPIVNIRKPHQIEVILKSNIFLTKSEHYDDIRLWLNEGLITSTDNVWYCNKRIITSVFNSENLKDFIIVMNQKAEILVKRMHSRIKKNCKAPHDMFDLIAKYGVDTNCKIAMGYDPDSLRNSDDNFVKALKNFYELSSDRRSFTWFKPGSLFSSREKEKVFLNTLRILKYFTEMIIEENMIDRREKTMTTDDDTSKNAERRLKSFLDLLLDMNEKSEKKLSLQEVRQEVDTFLYASHDSISVCISWALFTLGNAPSVQEKVHEEIKQVLGEFSQQATIEQLAQMNYLDRVIKEVLRLYPSFPCISRCLDNDAVIDRYFIPGGTTINIQIYQLHHDPQVWIDPEVFDPDRFLPENSEKRKPYSYLPFSAGPRSCIAQHFAILQIKIVLTSILRKWRVISVFKPYEIKIVSNSYTLRPCDDKIELYFVNNP